MVKQLRLRPHEEQGFESPRGHHFVISAGGSVGRAADCNQQVGVQVRPPAPIYNLDCYTL